MPNRYNAATLEKKVFKWDMFNRHYMKDKLNDKFEIFVNAYLPTYTYCVLKL